MRKVLIFYGSYGGGHLSAARNIKEYIDLNYKDTQTFLVDCIEYINAALNKVSTKAFVGMSRNAHWAWRQLYSRADYGALSKITTTANKVMAVKLKKLIEVIDPDLIISTHPFSSQMCSILKKKGKFNCKLATVITDYESHSQWCMNPEVVDYFFIAHEGIRDELIEKKVNKSTIFVTGIPLSNRFLAHYDKEKVLNEFGLENR